MKVKALRGVCIGVDRHLIAGDIADLEPALVTFLVGIGAVALVPVEPEKPPEPPRPEPAPPEPEPPPAPVETKLEPTAPAKVGKKEK